MFTMKLSITSIFGLIILLFSTKISAQAKIGDNANNLNPNVLLELESTDRGLLIPRMSSSQRDNAFITNIPNS